MKYFPLLSICTLFLKIFIPELVSARSTYEYSKIELATVINLDACTIPIFCYKGVLFC